MKVIIAGGSGLIGRAIMRSLAKDGYEVVILSRNLGEVTGLPDKARAVFWDGKSGGDWGGEFNGADVVINLSGASLAGDSPLNMRWSEKRKKILWDSRVKSGNAISSAIESCERKPGLLIQSSAVGYYGPLDEEPVDEGHHAGNDYLAKLCQAWEQSSEKVEELGVRRVVIRTGVVLDNENIVMNYLKLPFLLFVGGPLGNGRQYFPWIHMADVVGAIRYLIDNKSASDAYNLTAPGTITNNELSKAMGKVLRRPAFMRVPAFLMRLVFGEVSTVMLDGQNAVPARLKEFGYKFQFPTIKEALRDVLKK